MFEMIPEGSLVFFLLVDHHDYFQGAPADCQFRMTLTILTSLVLLLWMMSTRQIHKLGTFLSFGSFQLLTQ